MVNVHSKRVVMRDRNFLVSEQADITGLQTYMNNKVWPDENAKRDWRNMPNQLYVRPKVRVKSAMCAYFVIHALTRTDHASKKIRTIDILGLLEKHYPQIAWEPYSVGKLLGEASRACELLVHPQIYWQDHIWLPLQRTRDYTGIWYYTYEAPTTTAWLWAMLAELQPEAEKERDDPEYTAGDGTWGKGFGSTAMYTAGFRIRSKMIEAQKGNNKGAEALFDVHPVWTFSHAEVRYR